MVLKFFLRIEADVTAVEYPDNSYESKRKTSPIADDPEKPESVVRGKVHRRKKSIGSRIAETFTGEDARSVISSIVWDTLVPTVRDAVTEAIVQGVERMIRGEVRQTSRRPGYRPGDNQSRHNYRQYSSPSRDERTRPPAGRRPRKSGLDYRDIQLENRADADNVMRGLEDKLHRLGSVSLADLYRDLGFEEDEIDYTDDEHGWFSARGWDIRLERGGHRLIFPRPENLRD